jgi:type I restriction enzyme S subunit
MNLTDLKFMQLTARHRERYIVRAGDVLFNRTNSPDLVGKTAIYRNMKPMAYAGYLVRLRTNGENDPEYLSSFLNTGYAKRMLRGMCKSIIGMANINATEIQAMRIPQPSLALQNEFARHGEAESCASCLAVGDGRPFRLPPAPRLPRGIYEETRWK